MLTLSNVIAWCSVMLLFKTARNNLGLHVWGNETNNEMDERPEESKELKIVTSGSASSDPSFLFVEHRVAILFVLNTTVAFLEASTIAASESEVAERMSKIFTGFRSVSTPLCLVERGSFSKLLTNSPSGERET